MSEWDDPAYKEFLSEASASNLVGDHDWIVTEVGEERTVTPKEGQTFSPFKTRKIRGMLATAGNYKVDLDLNPPPPPDVLKAEKATYSAGKKLGIATTINMYKNLLEFYGKTPDQIQQGDLFRIKTRREKGKDGREGFLRIIAFLDPKKISKTSEEAAKKATEDAPPF